MTLRPFSGNRRLSEIVAALLGVCAAPLLSHAQQAPATAAAPAESTALEEVIVTAQRRSSNLQTTPIAVSAVDQQLITQIQPNTISDIAKFVPNFSATKITGFNAASFAMRGVGNTDIIVYNEAPVAVLVDDFVVPSPQTQILDAFDVQQVEVLRGPQGTLFGKNTTGGVVSVRTKAPLLGVTSFDAQASMGSFNAVNLQGALNIPLGSTLAMRLVVSSEKEDGWMRNGASNTLFPIPIIGFAGGTFTGDGQRKGGTDVLTGRAKLLWQPTDTFKTQFTFESVRDRSQTPAAVNETPAALKDPSDPSKGFYFAFANLGIPQNYTGNPLNAAGVDTRDGLLLDMSRGHRVDVDGFYLNTDWDVGPGSIAWVQGYRSQSSSLPSDYTGIVGPVAPFDANRSDRRYTWQEEIRFASKSDGPFNYVAGAFTQHDKTTFCVAQVLGIYDLFGATAFAPPGLEPGGYNNNPQVLCNRQTARSSAVFGEGNFKFNDKMTLTVGARYTWETKDFIARQQVFVQQLDAPVGSSAPYPIDPTLTWRTLGNLMNAADFAKYPFGVVTDNHKWKDPTYRASLSYEFTPDIFGYGTFSHGFKAGGYNDQIGTSGNPITSDEKKPTNPEKADSVELGLKMELADRRIRLNEAAFWVKYKDAIRQIVVPVTNLNGSPGEETLFRNAASLTVYGIENELTAQVMEGLIVRIPASYQHCKYSTFTTDNPAFATDPTAPATLDLTSVPVNRCPEFTGTVDVNYTLPLAIAGGKVAVDASANYQSKNLNTFSLVNQNEYARTYVDSRTLVDASITYTGANDRWFVRAFGRNLTDKVYRISGQNVDPLWVWALYGEPRFFGAQVGFKFSDK